MHFWAVAVLMNEVRFIQTRELFFLLLHGFLVSSLANCSLTLNSLLESRTGVSRFLSLNYRDSQINNANGNERTVNRHKLDSRLKLWPFWTTQNRADYSIYSTLGLEYTTASRYFIVGISSKADWTMRGMPTTFLRHWTLLCVPDSFRVGLDVVYL